MALPCYDDMITILKVYSHITHVNYPTPRNKRDQNIKGLETASL